MRTFSDSWVRAHWKTDTRRNWRNLKRAVTGGSKASRRKPKRIVNVRLDTRQLAAIEAVTDRNPLVTDTSKFVRLAVDHLLASDLGAVLKGLVQ
jgi:hypothetical protein